MKHQESSKILKNHTIAAKQKLLFSKVKPTKIINGKLDSVQSERSCKYWSIIIKYSKYKT